MNPPPAFEVHTVKDRETQTFLAQMGGTDARDQFLHAAENNAFGVVKAMGDISDLRLWQKLEAVETTGDVSGIKADAAATRALLLKALVYLDAVDADLDVLAVNA